MDIVVWGMIRQYGNAAALKIFSSCRPDLNDEALRIVSKWRFQPMMCNDVDVTQEADFVVHFQGR